MAIYNGSNAWVVIDGYEITGFTLEFEPPSPTAAFEDAHTLGDSWRKQLPTGIVDWSGSVNGFFDDDSGAFVSALSTQAGQASTRVLIWGVAGDTAGVQAGAGAVSQVSWAPTVSKGALTKAAARFSGSGRLAGNGRLLRKGTVTGTTGDGTAVDNTSSTANGGVATFWVTSTAGTVVQKVRHSSDGATYTDLATASSVGTGAAPAAQQVTVAGTVNRYLRHNFTNSTSPFVGGTAFERF